MKKNITEKGTKMATEVCGIVPKLPKDVLQYVRGYAQAIIDYDLHPKKA